MFKIFSKFSAIKPGKRSSHGVLNRQFTYSRVLRVHREESTTQWIIIDKNRNCYERRNIFLFTSKFEHFQNIINVFFCSRVVGQHNIVSILFLPSRDNVRSGNGFASGLDPLCSDIDLKLSTERFARNIVVNNRYLYLENRVGRVNVYIYARKFVRSFLHCYREYIYIYTAIDRRHALIIYNSLLFSRQILTKI